MARVFNGFESGSHGTAITTGNSGGGGATAFDAIPAAAGNTATYSNLQEHEGTLGAFYDVATTGTVYTEYSTGLGTQTEIYGRIYYRVSGAIPTSAFRPLRVQNAAAAVGAVQQNANGKLSLYDSTNTLRATSATILTPDTDYRIEWHVICAGAVGTLALRLYEDWDSGTATEELIATGNTGTQMTKYQCGIVTGSSTPLAVYLDDIGWDTATWLGPTFPSGAGLLVGVALTTGSGTVTTAGVPVVTGSGSAVGVAVTTGTGSTTSSVGVWPSYATAYSETGTPTTPTDFEILYLDSPYIRLGTQADQTAQNSGLQAAAAQERIDAANYWHHIHGEGGNFALNVGSPTLADQMTDLGVVCSEYRNGSYIPQSNSPPAETQYIETDPDALGISVFWPGNYGGPRDDTAGTVGRYTLASNLTVSGTSVSVRTVVSGNHNAPSDTVPSRLTGSLPPYVPNTWPYFASKGSGNNPGTGTSVTPQVAGTWVIKQVSAVPTGSALTQINTALGYQGCVGFGARIPWDVLEPTNGAYNDTLLNNLLAIATARGKKFKVRVMCGIYTPSFATGGTTLSVGGETIPAPFSAGGTPNATFRTQWTQLMQHLFAWARTKNTASNLVVPMIDAGTSPGYQYSELFFGPEVQTAYGNPVNTNAGYFVTANAELIQDALGAGCADGSDAMAVGFGWSGHGPIMTDYASLGGKCIAERLAETIRSTTGVDYSPRCYMQANGWGLGAESQATLREWGQAAAPEAALDAAVWPVKVRAGLQDIYPSTTNGGPRSAAENINMYAQARNGVGMNGQPGAYYVEIYEPTFVTGAGGANQQDAPALAELQNQMALHYSAYSSSGDSQSADTANCVSWVRIDDELMQVTNAPTFNASTGVTSFTVRRGLWGTQPTSHTSGDKVYSPVYIGAATGIDNADLGLSGTPVVHSATKPIRYAIAIYTSLGADFIADRIEATFGTPNWKGYNAVWYDVSGANRYNQADAWAWGVEAWHLTNGAPVNNTTWGQAQVYKFDRHRARGWENSDGDPILFYENGAGQNYPTWKAVALDQAVDVGLSEKWCDHTTRTAAGATINPITYTDTDVTTLFDVMATNRTMLFWLRWNRDPVWVNIDQGKRYGYGLYLMAYRVGNTSELMGPFSAAKGAVPGGGTQIMNNHTGTIFASSQATPPDDIFFWDWGTPQQNVTAITALQVGAAGLFRRDFANGTVLLNMTATARTADMGNTDYYNAMVINTSGNPTQIPSRTVTVPAYDALFLLKLTEGATSVFGTGVGVGVARATGNATLLAVPVGLAVCVALATGDGSLVRTGVALAVGVALATGGYNVEEGEAIAIGVCIATGTSTGGVHPGDGEAVGVGLAIGVASVFGRARVRRDRRFPPP